MGSEKQQVQQKNRGPSFPLALSSVGETVRIVMIRGCGKMKERLLSIGLQVDDSIEIVQCREKGAVLVAKDDNRFMLGGGMAQKIYVVKE
ncbi:MAG: ferrous iron transport protein A [Desulfocapsa sp.]|uniref:Ferrous iron transport protein A n=1 Tax=Desulfotalea psychrophila TaxID=84980 RepID=A0ABS3AYA2_9BACT|nr:ferrous iron transport protein A [Desulfocapsa sp.]MBN4068981.1 ferrous iron transport protein A [Desulfotalea psychrophila]